ncbi:sulfite exporter TauE/SafE family protein [Halomicrobium sp. LC1Hm]|uniref:sulfite exporter TauE/SafE family protein n=1 Tax=Halomicrobium sp. LC1Hm TaxID=2610902 RepID=UPI0012983C5F|nr:sulfite exporter TauE/SafE family protein [Halomicrobium sp. LC1Hm]
MALALTPTTVAVFVGVVLIAGAVNGLAGFGFALVGTMALATVVEPTTAVVFMIVPILAANASLVRELSVEDVRSCGRRFGPLLAAALIGTVVGLAVVDRLPAAPLRVGLGVVTLGFVATAQRAVPIPWFDRLKAGCFVETPLAMVAIGGVSGVLFGGTNVGVQLIAYLRSRDLSHELFVGVAAMIFLGLNAVRVGAAGALGLYPDLTTVALSVAAAVPAVAGVAVGRRLRVRIPEQARRRFVLGLLAVVGVRLVLGGLGIA